MSTVKGTQLRLKRLRDKPHARREATEMRMLFNRIGRMQILDGPRDGAVRTVTVASSETVLAIFGNEQ